VNSDPVDRPRSWPTHHQRSSDPGRLPPHSVGRPDHGDIPLRIRAQPDPTAHRWPPAALGSVVDGAPGAAALVIGTGAGAGLPGLPACLSAAPEMADHSGLVVVPARRDGAAHGPGTTPLGGVCRGRDRASHDAKEGALSRYEEVKVRLSKDDLGSLRDLGSQRGLGVSTLVRLVVRQFVDDQRATGALVSEGGSLS
jgi:hypothetical protein